MSVFGVLKYRKISQNIIHNEQKSVSLLHWNIIEELIRFCVAYINLFGVHKIFKRKFFEFGTKFNFEDTISMGFPQKILILLDF